MSTRPVNKFRYIQFSVNEAEKILNKYEHFGKDEFNFKTEVKKLFERIKSNEIDAMWQVDIDFTFLYRRMVYKWMYIIPDQFKWNHPINCQIKILVTFIQKIILAFEEDDGNEDTLTQDVGYDWIKNLWDECSAEIRSKANKNIINYCGWEDKGLIKTINIDELSERSKSWDE